VNDGFFEQSGADFKVIGLLRSSVDAWICFCCGMET
jgi:hypothetical protein